MISMVDYAGLSGCGALLLVTAPAETKKGRGELSALIDQWLSVYENSDGDLNRLVQYQAKGLEFLNQKLQKKKVQLIKSIKKEERL